MNTKPLWSPVSKEDKGDSTGKKVGKKMNDHLLRRS
jgi:hypothetical protein